MPVDDVAWLKLTWRKSQHSNPSGECVEVAQLGDGQIALRNSRDPHGAKILYTKGEIAAFLSGVKDGEFDYLVG